MDALTKEAVIAASDAFVEAWNHGDLEKACELYAEDATFVASGGLLIRSKSYIRQYHEQAFRNHGALGELSLELVEFRSPTNSEAGGAMASAIFQWTLKSPDGSAQLGHALETYTLKDGKVLIMQDASM